MRELNLPENWNFVPFPNIWKEPLGYAIDSAKDDSNPSGVVTFFKPERQPLLDKYGNVIQDDKPIAVWMSYEEVQAQKQFELKAISQMFPTLKGFLWDVEPKTKEDESQTL